MRIQASIHQSENDSADEAISRTHNFSAISTRIVDQKFFRITVRVILRDDERGARINQRNAKHFKYVWMLQVLPSLDSTQKLESL